jgi:pimeloyl-ACP methyl ester carboxylesterase
MKARCKNSLKCLLTVFALVLVNSELVAEVQAQISSYKSGGGESSHQFHAAERYVLAGETRLHYIDHGQGQPVVLIHGNAGDLRDFNFGTLDLLAGHYRALAFDLPGHGHSKVSRKNGGTLQEQAKALHQALRLIGVENPILVGHSWGGAVALAYVLLYPEDVAALVLLAPAAYSDHSHDAPRAAFLLRAPVLGELCLGLIKPFWGKKLLRDALKKAFSPDHVPHDYFKSATAWLGREQIKTFIKNDATLNAGLQDLSSQYQKIRAPVIIVTGDSDLMVSPQQNAFQLYRTIGHAQLVVIPRTGHQIPQTRPQAVLQAVDLAAAGSAIFGGEAKSLTEFLR